MSFSSDVSSVGALFRLGWSTGAMSPEFPEVVGGTVDGGAVGAGVEGAACWYCPKLGGARVGGVPVSGARFWFPLDGYPWPAGGMDGIGTVCESPDPIALTCPTPPEGAAPNGVVVGVPKAGCMVLQLSAVDGPQLADPQLLDGGGVSGEG